MAMSRPRQMSIVSESLVYFHFIIWFKFVIFHAGQIEAKYYLGTEPSLVAYKNQHIFSNFKCDICFQAFLFHYQISF